MLRITHTRGPRAPGVEQLGHAVVRLGTAPDGEVVFPEGVGVAPRHAEIRAAAGGGFQLVDLGSAGGTFVHGARVGARALAQGDVIALGGPGGPELRIEMLAPGVAPAVPEGGVDVETAQRLVHQAVLEAVQREEKAAHLVAARLGEVERKVGRHNTALSLGVGVALLATVAAGVAVYRAQHDAAVLRAEIGVDNAPAAPPAGTVPTRVYSGREIYDQNRAALYVIGFLSGNRIGGCCTSFAVGPNLLATNAHCVLAYREQGGTPVVIQNDSGGKVRLKIVASSIHPGYKPGTNTENTPDVGLLRVDTRMARLVTLASDAELRAIGPGDDLFVFGFPGRVMDPGNPLATFLQGHVGRVMGLQEEATSFDKALLLQHDAQTRGGNSGSPIFNQYGHVMGVHAAHIDEENQQTLDGQKTTVVAESAFRIGMRIDLLQGVPPP